MVVRLVAAVDAAANAPPTPTLLSVLVMKPRFNFDKSNRIWNPIFARRLHHRRGYGHSGEVACRLGQLASPDVCGPGEIDARTEAVIAKRVASALTLLDKASQVSGDARKTLLGKVARQLGALRRRVSRAEARETIPGDCYRHWRA